MATFERATVGLFVWCSANAALGDGARRVNAVSRYGVTETVELIEEAARKRALSVQHIDHGAEAAAAGFRLRPTHSLSIGQGQARLKLVVWQAPDGATVVTARDRRALAMALAAVGLLDRTAYRSEEWRKHRHVFARSH